MERRGLLAAVSAFAIWGLSPIFWKLLKDLSPIELVAHRVVWAFLLLGLWVSVRRGWLDVRRTLGDRRTLRALAASTLLIASNWLVYIHAVTSGQVLEASLGYFINPLVSVLLGVAVLRESLNRRRRTAVALAASGVLLLTAAYGRIPWIALVLAGSFGLYGLLRKVMAADAVVGLLVETACLAPVAVTWTVWLGSRGDGAVGHAAPETHAVLVASGAVTALPLVLFTFGARRLPLSTIGLLQYLAPTVQFLLAVLVYHETFTALHAAAFILIWSGLAVFTADLRRSRRAPSRRAT